jgi:hypothetical protein
MLMPKKSFFSANWNFRLMVIEKWILIVFFTPALAGKQPVEHNVLKKRSRRREKFRCRALLYTDLPVSVEN